MKKFEDIFVKHIEDIDAGRSDIENCSCNSRTTGCQAPSHLQGEGPVPAYGADSWQGGCNKMTQVSL